MADKRKRGQLKAKFRNLILDAFTKKPSTGKQSKDSAKTHLTSSILDIHSPVRALLASNIQPTDDEISLVRAFIKRAKEEVQLQNGEPSDPQHLERVTYLIKQHQSILSPLRRLPVELLQGIFMHIPAPSPMPHGYNDIYAGLVPEPMSLSFSQVSRYWRAAALSCASLWRTVPHINLDDVATRGSLSTYALLHSTS
ncbi:hypothetical protein CPC08DRAFT_722514 [Agrocybe pediades]|nr:hypothetical protein CPC08DRAFT_722514 [Agrocybe pediades]